MADPRTAAPPLPRDRRGRPLAAGDWVRLVEVPPPVAAAPPETREVFAAALGKTFRIEAFDEHGHAELDLTAKVARRETIWVEPEHLERSRPGRRSA